MTWPPGSVIESLLGLGPVKTLNPALGGMSGRRHAVGAAFSSIFLSACAPNSSGVLGTVAPATVRNVMGHNRKSCPPAIAKLFS